LPAPAPRGANKPGAETVLLGSHFKHDPLDGAPGRKITAWRTPCRQARQGGQRDTGNAVDQLINIRPAHQFELFSPSAAVAASKS
jgi:hypothetical protein